MNVAQIMAVAENGAEWKKQGKKGYALCPFCNSRLLVKSTQGAVRYCKCSDSSCIANILNLTIKAS